MTFTKEHETYKSLIVNTNIPLNNAGRP